MLKQALVTILILCALMSSGCASPKPEPFRAYAQSLISLREGVEHAIKIDASEARTRFIEMASAMSDRDAGNLLDQQIRRQVAFDDVFSLNPAPSPALFFQVEEVARTLESINDAFVQHANLLASLAASEIVSDKSIDTIAGQINGHARDFVDAMNTAKSLMPADAGGLISVPPRELALLSSVAAEFLRQYLLKRQTGALNDAINASADTVRIYASAVQLLLEAIAIGERQRFAEKAKAIDDALADTGNDSKRRRDLIIQSIELNERALKALDTLKVIHDAYGRLPEAFFSLKGAAGGPRKLPDDLWHFAADARRVVKRYESLK